MLNKLISIIPSCPVTEALIQDQFKQYQENQLLQNKCQRRNITLICN